MTRGPRRAVTFRILAGMTVIGGLSAATGAVAVSLLSASSREIERIAAAVPDLGDAARLVRQGGAIAEATAALVAAPDQTAREAEMARMGERIARLDELVPRLIADGVAAGPSADPGGGLEALEHHKNELVRVLQTLNAQVRQQLVLTAEADARARSLDTVAASLGALAAEDRDGAAAAGGGGADGLGRAAQERWRREINAASSLLLAVLHAERDTQLDRLQADARGALGSAARELALLPPERASRLKPVQDGLEAAAFGAAFGQAPLATLRAAELSLRRAAERSAARSRMISDRMAIIVSDHLAAVEQDVARRVRARDGAAGDGALAVAVMTLLSLLGMAALAAAIRRAAAPAPPDPKTPLAPDLPATKLPATDLPTTDLPATDPPSLTPAVLDLGHVVETFGSLDQGAVEMMDFFIETTRPTLEHALAALAAGDAEAARAAAHTVAGAARTAGASALAGAAAALERALLDGRTADAVRHADAMAAAFPAVEKAIHALHHTKKMVPLPKECMTEPDPPT
ncbi:Hpt domain-containing protein [Azospirillum picis]|uniref:HPt (Histidine-containing phosphotransfer) domain-containing protein n=1 Tax=Azospirillum picis TaxID=488438 RepID=A0ABU0MM03_9PROT|nr:Hpt domain-containing protein [Azospirillum picis]MBP2300447.1 HPt (histidine-containing phosphotransfer) domain-containing protein [Azospirillum picis]MDQ0534243.1 HPt (histidine-containing phosphotransfer) domain-containing protein [Azospirillum picis]